MIEKLLKMAKDIFKKKSENTRKYDQVSSEVRNLLKATGATFIPRLCNALKEDWYPDRTEKEIQNNEDAREEIRSKIINEWSDEGAGENGVWKEFSIGLWFPKWLKEPEQQERSKNAWEKRKEKAQYKYIEAIEEQNISKKLENLAKITPPAPKEEIQYTEPTFDVEDKDSFLTPIGEKGHTPFISMTELNQAQWHLWNMLTDKNDWPGIRDDILNDYVKPTREIRSSFLAELQPHEQNGIARRCGNLIAVLEDTIQTIENLAKS